MRIAVIADTHMPRGARRLPDRCLEVIAGADAVIHAGDFVTAAVLRDLETAGRPVHAVYGNVDDSELRQTLPAELTLELGGRTLAVVHDGGPRRGRLARLRHRFPQADVVVFGHSHMPLHEEEGGFHIFNPGSPTERRRAPQRSMGLIVIDASRMALRHIGLS